MEPRAHADRARRRRRPHRGARGRHAPVPGPVAISTRSLPGLQDLRPAAILTMATMPPIAAPVLLDTTDPAHYALGRSDAEARRLMLQHRIYGAATRQLLTEAGIATGMRVLDVGSGAGDVALLLADLVGPTGEVVGVEMPRSRSPSPRRGRGRGAGTPCGSCRRPARPRPRRGPVRRRRRALGADVPARSRRPAAPPRGPRAPRRGRRLPGERPRRRPPDVPGRAAARPGPGLDAPPVDTGGRDAHGPAPVRGVRRRRAAGADGAHRHAGRRRSRVAGLRVRRGDDAQPAADARRRRRCRPDEVGLDTLADRLRDEVVERDGIQPLASVYGAWARVA